MAMSPAEFEAAAPRFLGVSIRCPESLGFSVSGTGRVCARVATH